MKDMTHKLNAVWLSSLEGMPSAILLLFALLMVGAPFFGMFGASPHNVIRLLELGFLAFASMAAARYFWHCSIHPGRVWVFLLFIAVWGVIAAALAFETLVAVREWALLVGVVLLALQLGVYLQKQPDGPRLFAQTVIAAGAGYVLFVASWLLLVLTHEHTLNPWLLVPGYDNPRLMNHVQVLMLPLLAGCVVTDFAPKRPYFWRAMAWVGLVGQFCLLVVTYGRAACLAIGVSAVIGRLTIGKQAEPILTRLFFGALGGLLAYVVLFRVVPDALGIVLGGVQPERADVAADHSRYFLWRIALDHIANSPWFGVGPMHYAHYPNRAGAHPHNIYLQLAAEWGVPVLLTLVLVVGYLLSRVRRHLVVPASGCTPMHGAAFIACIAVVIDGMFSGNIVMPMSQLWIIATMGLLISAVPQDQQNQARWRTLPLSWTRVLLLAWALLQLACFVPAAMEFQMDKPTLFERTPPVNPGPLDRPRFWRLGWF